MPQINDKALSRAQSVGTWLVAVGLLIYEGLSRHFADQSGLALLGGLLGLPVIANFEKNRRAAKKDGDKDSDEKDDDDSS